MKKQRFKKMAALLALCGLSLTANMFLSGCSGSDKNNNVTLSGKVADGYLQNARVCLDTDNDYKCEGEQYVTTTGAGGVYSLVIPVGYATSYNVVAEAIAGETIDEDNPGITITQSYTLTAPIGSHSFISPYTTLLQGRIADGQTTEEAQQGLQTLLGIASDTDLSADYLAGETASTNLAIQAAAIAGILAGAQGDNEDASFEELMQQVEEKLQEAPIPDYNVTPTVSGTGGSITPATMQEILESATATFTVTPDDGYKIDTVTGCNGTLNGNSYTTGPINGNCTVTASFIILNYNVTPQVSGTGGSISPASVQQIQSGRTTTFTVTPDASYEINTVSGCNGTLSGNSYTTGPITGDCTVTANFKNIIIPGYNVTPTVSGTGGSISPATVQEIAAGGTATFTVTPDDGYEMASVSGCNGSLNGYSYTTGPINGNCTVTAAFTQLPPMYTVTFDSNNAGCRTEPSAPQQVVSGQSITFDILVSEGLVLGGIDRTSGCGNASYVDNTFTYGPIIDNCDFTLQCFPATGDAKFEW